MSENKKYDVIFKSTFLFALVQALSILVKVVLNKVAAITLGSHGIGMIGLFTSAIGMVKTGTSLGISQSAVRDISEANQNDNSDDFSKTIITTQKIIILTAFIGFALTVLLSKWLSKWTFGNELYSTSFVILSFAVVFITLWEGQLAILKGMRYLRLLAKANILGSLVGLLLSVPLYFIYKENGIIPVIIITPLTAYLFSNYYVKDINFKKIKLSNKEVFHKALPMVKMGVALSITTFLSQISVFLISVYIGREAGLQTVGFYNAGVIIMVGYFSVVINALTTDYYPRIAAINNDNTKLQKELNQQSIVSLIITFPLVILFLLLLPLIIIVLYSEEFYPIIDFVRIGIFGVLITIISNQVDLILIAKNNTKIFSILALFYRIVELVFNILLFHFYGLSGMGISMVLTGVIHLLIMTFAVKKLYSISFESLFIKTAFLGLIFVLITSYISVLENVNIRYSVGGILFIVACLFSFYFSKIYLNFDVLKIVSK